VTELQRRYPLFETVYLSRGACAQVERAEKVLVHPPPLVWCCGEVPGEQNYFVLAQAGVQPLQALSHGLEFLFAHA